MFIFWTNPSQYHSVSSKSKHIIIYLTKSPWWLAWYCSLDPSFLGYARWISPTYHKPKNRKTRKCHIKDVDQFPDFPMVAVHSVLQKTLWKVSQTRSPHPAGQLRGAYWDTAGCARALSQDVDEIVTCWLLMGSSLGVLNAATGFVRYSSHFSGMCSGQIDTISTRFFLPDFVGIFPHITLNHRL